MIVFLRKEPSADSNMIGYRTDHCKDVMVYADKSANKPIARWSWGQSPPRKNHKTVMLNCTRQPCIWLKDK
jgi:hypothetical protein